MRCSKSRYYSDLELVGTFEKLLKANFSNVALTKSENLSRIRRVLEIGDVGFANFRSF